MNKYSRFGFGADDQPPPSTDSPPLPAIEIPNSSKLGHQIGHDFQIPNSSNPTPLRWFLPGFFDGVEYDEVDTTLSLRPPGTTPPPNQKSTKPPPEKLEEPQTSAAAANNNIPLPPLLINSANNQSRKRPRINTADTDHPRPPSAAAAAARTAAVPISVKVGREKLEEWDLDTRLVLTRDREEMLWKFLTAEEAAAVGDGLAVVGFDTKKRVYRNLRITARRGGVVIEGEWSKVINANKPKVGNVVKIRGLRVKGNPCLAFNFREDQTN